MPESDLTYRTTTFPSPAMVPSEYAEKAMGSLMQLHSQLMDEKERRVDLYRRLMDREQALAELRVYVRILEERLGIAEPSPAPSPPANPPEVPRRPPSANNFRIPPRKEVMSGWKVW